MEAGSRRLRPELARDHRGYVIAGFTAFAEHSAHGINVAERHVAEARQRGINGLRKVDLAVADRRQFTMERPLWRQVNFPLTTGTFSKLSAASTDSVPLLLEEAVFQFCRVLRLPAFSRAWREEAGRAVPGYGEVVSRVDSVRRKPLLDYSAPR